MVAAMSCLSADTMCFQGMANVQLEGMIIWIYLLEIAGCVSICADNQD